MSKPRLTTLKPRVSMAPTKVQTFTVRAVLRSHDRAWQRTRARILRRDNGLCWACAACGLVGLAQQVDHRLPVWVGGTDDDANLGSMCIPHHQQKSTHETRLRNAGMAWEPWSPDPRDRTR